VDVLPGDLNQVLRDFGNLLADDDDEENTEPEPDFDLNNPGHREALVERMHGI